MAPTSTSTFSPRALTTDNKLITLFSSHSRRRHSAAAGSSNNSLILATSTLRRPASSSWASVQADVHARLLSYLPAAAPPSVTDPMRHFIAAAPTTPAPALCLAACELAGGLRAHAMDAACALLLLHAAAAAHDRWGKQPRPTGSPYSDGVRLLTYQSMSGMAYEIVARSTAVGGGGGDDHVRRRLRVAVEMAEAAGARGVVEGQFAESSSELGGGVVELEAVCEKKEGRVCACAAACGAILGGGSEAAAVVERLRRFGRHVGTMHGLLVAAGEGRERSKSAAEKFWRLARAEVDGLDEAGEVVELVDWLYHEGWTGQALGVSSDCD